MLYSRSLLAIYIIYIVVYIWGFPGGSDDKEFACNAGDPGLIPGSGRFPGGSHGNTLQYPCLENPMDRGSWWTTVQGLQRVRCDWSNLAHTGQCIYVIPNLPTHPSPIFPLVTVSLFSLDLWLCFCFIKEFICIIFKDSSSTFIVLFTLLFTCLILTMDWAWWGWEPCSFC